MRKYPIPPVDCTDSRHPRSSHLKSALALPLILACALLLFLAAPTAQANIIQTFDFETSDTSQLNSIHKEGTTASITASSTQARQGTYSMQSYIANADKRAEGVSSRRGTVGGVNWYGWSIYVPSNAGSTTFDIISQFHDWHSSQPAWAQDGVAPTCIVATTGGHLQLDLKFQKVGLNETDHDYFDLGAFTPNAWHDIVVYVKWTHETSGFMKVWVNGVLKMDYTGPTYLDYGAGNGPYFKMGNYKGIFNWSGSSPRIYYMDEFRMGDGYSNYAEVDPARGENNTELLAYEGFDYATGSVDGANGGTGWSSAWSAWGTGGDTSVISGGFSYTDLETAGNRFRVYDSDGNFQGITRTLTTEMGTEEGTYWLSFMAKKNSSGREGYIQFGNMILRAYQGNDWQIKTPNTSYTTLTGANYSTPHFFLVRVDVGASSDTVYVWVDPTLASGEPTTGTALATLTDNSGFTFDTVTIKHGPWGGSASQSSEWDELRIGTSFAAVTPGPEAELFVYEPFDYATGSIDGADGGYGWATDWAIGGGAGDTSVISSGFTYTNLVTAGNRFRIYDTDGSHQSATRYLSESVGSEPGTYWLSFMAKKNNSGREAYIKFGPLVFKATSGDWQVKSEGTSYTTLTGAGYSTTHLFLVRIDAAPGGNVTRVWVDPTLASGEPATGTALVTLNDNSFFSFNALVIQHGPYGSSSQSGEWDEIRIATTFADAVGGSFQTVLETDADAYVRNGSYSTNNFGTDANLWVKEDTNSEYDRKTFLRFDLSSYGGSINTATLVLTPNLVGSDTANTSFQIYLVADDSWSETGITWSNQPSASTLLDTVDGSTVTEDVPVEFDVTSAAASALSGDGELSLVILSTSAGGNRYVVFDSYESSVSPPLLIVE